MIPQPPSEAPENLRLEAAIKSLNESRAIFILRLILAAEKISPHALQAAIDLTDRLGIGND